MLKDLDAKHVIELAIGEGDSSSVVVEDVCLVLHPELISRFNVDSDVLRVTEQFAPGRLSRADVEYTALAFTQLDLQKSKYRQKLKVQKAPDGEKRLVVRGGADCNRLKRLRQLNSLRVQRVN
jgi:1,6-anhydro-N-acetylmuramate kinase